MISSSNPIKKKILVIDDEINGLSSEVASQLFNDLFAELNDPTSLILEEINNIIEKYFSHFNLEENPHTSTNFLRNILLNSIFFEKASDELQSLLTPLNQKNSLFLQFKEIIKKSFPSTEYEITFLEHSIESFSLDISSFSLIILDWYLDERTTNESYIKERLSTIEDLPPIILLTSYTKINTPEERSRFYNTTKISGAGLITLTKNKLISENFGSFGLSTISSILMKQRSISNDIRMYINGWEKALEDAKKRTLETLWQLDTYIFKSIQEDATIDGQPYHDHFHNFIQKENSWHIERELDITNSIESLGSKLEKIEYCNILTHSIDSSSFLLHRNMLNHQSFKGYDHDLSIQSKKREELKNSILHDIPFGAVLKSGPINTPLDEVYINITQPCDLSDIVRSPKKSIRSIQLIKMSPEKKSLNQSAIFDTSNYTITDFFINNDYYDLKPLPMSIISLSFEDFYEFSCSHTLNVIGEVRNDVAVGLQQKAVSYLIRPSQQRTQRPSISSAQIFLIKNLPTGAHNAEGNPLFANTFIEYHTPTNITGTEDQKTRKKFIQLVSSDHFELTEWIITNLINQNVQKSDLIDFLSKRNEVKDKVLDKTIGKLSIKFIKIQKDKSTAQIIQELKLNKNSECLCILHQAYHL